jgi:hypothetical protein
MATAARNNPESPVVCGHWMSDEQTFHNPLRLREGLPTDRELAHLLGRRWIYQYRSACGQEP